MNCICSHPKVFLHGDSKVLSKFSFLCFRYMAPPPPPHYDAYGGYPVAPVPMPAPTPTPAPSSYVPVQVFLYHFHLILANK